MVLIFIVNIIILIIKIDNNIRYISNSISNNRKEDYFKHVFIFNDHGLYDDYSIFDDYSIILHIFLHPEEYPRVDDLMMISCIVL